DVHEEVTPAEVNEVRRRKPPMLPELERLPLVASPGTHGVAAEPEPDAEHGDQQHDGPAAPGVAYRRRRGERTVGVHGLAPVFVLSSAAYPLWVSRPAKRSFPTPAPEESTGMSPRISIATSLERGFTLIEIMVVVVIIGLLAAFVAPNLM